MKASELRIGNSIMQDGDFVFVTWWRLELMEKNKLEYKPIPLTEEWLFKFGFEKAYETCYQYKDFILNDKFIMMDIDITIQLKYVHQLQNLYHALTDEELTIKDEVY